MVSLNSGQRLQHGEHAASTVNSTMRSVSGQGSGVALHCAEHLQTRQESRSDSVSSSVLCGPANRARWIEALTLLWIGERGGDAVSPLFPRDCRSDRGCGLIGIDST